MSQSSTKVIIAGCGIAGPILAVLAKQQYKPVIYERLESLTETDVSLCLQVNGLKVLPRIPGLVEFIEGSPAKVEVPAQLEGRYGTNEFGLGVQRPTFHRKLVDLSEAHDIPINWGHQLTRLEQHSGSVTVIFQDGYCEIRRGMRWDPQQYESMYAKDQLSSTHTRIGHGLLQIGGLSPNPSGSGWPFEKPTLTNVVGNGEHFITCSVSETQLMGPEAKETWQAMDDEAQENFRRHSPIVSWGVGVGELIRNTVKVTKYGLYDCPQLKSWHIGRVVLLGDAAHPTSPHLGQGADQAFEDTAYLTDLLEKYNPNAQHSSTELLENIFSEYEQVRIPRTAALVAEARYQGDLRVISGIEECKKRNEIYRALWVDEKVIKKRHTAMFGPKSGVE